MKPRNGNMTGAERTSLRTALLAQGWTNPQAAHYINTMAQGRRGEASDSLKGEIKRLKNV